MNIVRQRENLPIYNILLILTDGEIHDMEQTKQIIVESSKHPISVIIIGVGEEKFELMRQLDSDESVLRDNFGHAAVRDVVQFVKFKEFMGRASELAAEVLKEVPEQLVNYMLYKGIMPQGFKQNNL